MILIFKKEVEHGQSCNCITYCFFLSRPDSIALYVQGCKHNFEINILRAGPSSEATCTMPLDIIFMVWHKKSFEIFIINAYMQTDDP